MHNIVHLTFPVKKTPGAIQKICAKVADENGDYLGQIEDRGIRFKDRVLDSRESAKRWIEENDSGWYDNLAVKFKDGRKIMWLVKIEFHC
jgi:hypothetical protein